MRILAKTFGLILTSRPSGREAALAILHNLRIPENEPVELDFEGVLSVSPSRLDEVLTALRQRLGRDRVVCLDRGNPSVTASLEVIDGTDQPP